jgi:hypothetical protein
MDKLAALVPELYYDLIGRLVPGALGIALFAAKVLDPTPPRVPTSEFLLACFAVVAAYAAGLLLDAASGLRAYPKSGQDC